MSKTAREVIAEQRVHGVEIAYRADYILKALEDAGFVIVPKNDASAALLALDENALLGVVMVLTGGSANPNAVRSRLATIRSEAKPK